jgi:hypothetical protein
MKNKTWLVLLGCIAMIGMGEDCEPPKTDKLAITPKVEQPTNKVNQVEKLELFTITSKGTFKAGYDNAPREIFIIRNNLTGEEYLGITDCTLIKQVNKKRDDARNQAIDTIGDVLSAFADSD